MVRVLGILALYLTVFLPALPVAAQRSNPEINLNAAGRSPVSASLTVGEPVRVEMNTPEPSEMQGVLVGVEGSELLIAPAGQSEVVRVQAHQLRRIQVYGGEQRMALKGLGYGAAGGAFVGVGLGLASGDDSSSCWLFCYTAEEKAALGGVSLGLVGGVLGLIAGALTKEIRWDDVSLPSMRPSINPSSMGGVEIRLTLPTRR